MGSVGLGNYMVGGYEQEIARCDVISNGLGNGGLVFVCGVIVKGLGMRRCLRAAA